MAERRANIPPRYAVRLRDLRPYHILTAACPACDHRASMRLWRITAGNPESTFLTTVERRLRCQRCGARGDATLLVTVTEEGQQRQALDPFCGKAHDGRMAALKIHYDGWVKLPAGLLRALGAKAGGTLEASPREDGLVLRTADKKRIPREPQLSDPAPAASGTEDAPPAPKAPRAARPTQVAVALPPALRGAGRRRKVGAPDGPAG